MNHYFKCFLAYFKTNILMWAEYKIDFLTTNISNVIFLAVAVINIEIIFTQVNEILGWNKYYIFWMLGFYELVKVLWNTFFINTVDIGYWVRTGNLDIFIIRPLNTLFQLICAGRYNTEYAFDELVIGLGLLFYANSNIAIDWNVISVLHFGVSLVSAVLIYGSIILLLSCVSLWTVQSHALMEFIAHIEELIQYPIDIYGYAIKLFLTILVPLGFISYYPSLYFFNSNEYSWVAIVVPLVAFLLTFISIEIWKKGLKSYQGTGS